MCEAHTHPLNYMLSFQSFTVISFSHASFIKQVLPCMIIKPQKRNGLTTVDSRFLEEKYTQAFII